MEALHQHILEILLENAQATAAQMAVMLNKTEADVQQALDSLRADGVLMGSHVLINWGKTDAQLVTALIEVKVTPQWEQGFDAIARAIYSYPEVRTVYLMSGAYDLAVFVEGRTIQDVAFFVAEKLAPLESVLSTATHFMLKCYKQDGVYMEKDVSDPRLVVSY